MQLDAVDCLKHLLWQQPGGPDHLLKTADMLSVVQPQQQLTTESDDLANKLYSIIYADPGWSYNDQAVAGKRGAGFKYRTMKPAEIAQLLVASIAATDCTLFLWATCPMLPEALKVMSAWGFQYKTVAFAWVKQSKRNQKLHWGMGNWTRANAELCLLGVRGKPKRINAGVHQIIESPIQEHSRKPNEVRRRIVQLMGDLRRIELFARERVAGWDCWGDEVDSDNDLRP